MYDPMTLSQTYDAKPTQFAQVISEGKKDTPAAEKAAAPKAAAAAPKSDPATDAALKKKWCVENVESTFFNADGAPRSALEQFSTFVNNICPQLEAEVPSKYRTFQQKL